MNIIFGEENVKHVDSKYTVLELDTFRFMPYNQVVKAYCVVEQIPILEMPRVESMRNLHQNLMLNYYKRDWNYCGQALEHLTGFWGGELDSFYTVMNERIAKYIEQDPGEEWDGIIEKVVLDQ